MARRFFVQEPVAPGLRSIRGNLFRHARVLRMRAGQELILVTEKTGEEFPAVIREMGKDFLLVEVGAGLDVIPAAVAGIALCQGLAKGEKMDLVVQKATEMGVSSFLPCLCERSVSRPPQEKRDDRRTRWQTIAREAARQSGRNQPPTVLPVQDFATAVASAGQQVKIMLWEGEAERYLRNLAQETDFRQDLIIAVGPEGGFSPAEAGIAIEAGFIPVSLGKAILRTETAGLAAVAIIQYLRGELG